MDGQQPLSALLSQAFVAFTIECDNDFEQRVPHRTAADGRTGRLREVPWLTSMAMWFTCLRFVDGENRTVREVERLARTDTNWNGMERWGYVHVAPDPADPRPRPPYRDWIVRATPAGRRAQAAWRPLSDEVEGRWRERFGVARVTGMREHLATIATQLDPGLPDCLPILGFGLFSRLPEPRPSPARGEAGDDSAPVALPSLMARVLLGIALEFEDHWPISLATSADILRILDERAQPLRDLPAASGVSKEAISMALGVLGKAGLVDIEAAPGAGRGKVARLTTTGMAAQAAGVARLAAIEGTWPARFGHDAIAGLRAGLEAIVDPGAERSPLFGGLTPPPGGWRASVPAPATLPHFPMVLHRGGFPDGS
ncbi:MAG TPA: MarR family winged helix-turn-helix transcriptional regulator [Candidatus Limnocylindrales bacterium]